jgi:hypothetical protein
MKVAGIKNPAFARQLSETKRADESARLQDPLVSVLVSDDGVAEALRRNAEMDSDPSIKISLQDFERRIRRLV